MDLIPHSQTPSREYIVYYCDEMETMARALYACDPRKFQLAHTDWRRFRDGEANLFVHDLEVCRERDVVFLASWTSLAQKYMQYAVLCVLASKSWAHSLTVVMPYFPAATMERSDHPGTVATAAIDARLLNYLPRMHRTIKVIIYDLHTLQNEFYFHRSCTPLMRSAIPLLRLRLQHWHSNEKRCIAFPDNGASKRFSHLFQDDFEFVICAKIRKGDTRKVTLYEGDPRNKHVCIVDDLVKTGGTLLQCAYALKSAGARSVSAFVTHGIFPCESYRKFMEHGLFERVFITDTVPAVATKLKAIGKPFEVLSIVKDLTHTL